MGEWADKRADAGVKRHCIVGNGGGSRAYLLIILLYFNILSVMKCHSLALETATVVHLFTLIQLYPVAEVLYKVVALRYIARV